MNRLSLEQFARRADHVVWKVLDGKGILLNLEDGAYFEVNPVGLTIWEGLDGRSTLGQLARRIEAGFKAPAARVDRELLEFVRELKRRKIVELSARPSRAAAPRR